jgi:hypothetical protein
VTAKPPRLGCLGLIGLVLLIGGVAAWSSMAAGVVFFIVVTLVMFNRADWNRRHRVGR